MTYREQLEKVKELGINVGELLIADECDCVLDFEMSDKDFEDICGFAYYIYLKSECLTVNAIARCINDMVTVEGKTIDEVIATEKWDFIDKASYYMD